MIRNKDKLLKKFAQMAKGAQKILEDEMEDLADQMVSSAKRFAPTRTGALRDSIQATPAGQPAPPETGIDVVPPGSVAVTVGNDKVKYAAVVEWGQGAHLQEGMFAGTQHPGTAPQPFFFPAYRVVRKKTRTAVSRALRKYNRGIASK